ncbi:MULTISPECIES: DUF2382 domain-containing protein [unclassified Microcoleus]|uniref:DUF2382 domain-containing protein n=1 Tax=unclassified Microcoleus TaxID=2642155 RepID=UPI002FD1B8C7
MLLYKIEDFNPNYREAAFDGEDIKGLDIYAGNTDEKIGSIDTALVDETGRFRYFVVDTGFWIFGKKVLVPVALCRVDVEAERIYATGLSSKDQAERLPRYEDGMVVDYDYEEQVRGVYRTLTVEASAPVEASLPLETSLPVQASAPVSMPRSVSNQARAAGYDRNTYTYEQEPQLYQMNEREHHKFRLYEERLVAEKSRHKTGEVAIGKRVETETARVSIPTEKERVVIERITPEKAGAPVNRDTPFQQEHVMRMEVYEETADIKKEAFVREEVNIRKEVETEIVEAGETLRREELDVKTEGH